MLLSLLSSHTPAVKGKLKAIREKAIRKKSKKKKATRKKAIRKTSVDDAGNPVVSLSGPKSTVGPNADFGEYST